MWSIRYFVLVMFLIAMIVMGVAHVVEAHPQAYCDAAWAEWTAKAEVQVSFGLLAEAGELRSQCRIIDREQVRRTYTTAAGAERWRALVSVYWPADLVDRALCVLWEESKGNPGIANTRGSGAAGLFQIMPGWWDRHLPSEYRGDRYDPATNVRAAYYIYTVQGWTAWTVLPLC